MKFARTLDLLKGGGDIASVTDVVVFGPGGVGVE